MRVNDRGNIYKTMVIRKQSKEELCLQLTRQINEETEERFRGTISPFLTGCTWRDDISEHFNCTYQK